VRFDLAVKSLAPDLKIVAPQRERNLSRDIAMEYAAAHGIEVPTTKRSPYSIDENLWGRSIEGGVLEDPAQIPPEDAFAWTKSWQDAPNEPGLLRIAFEKGVPVAVDGEALSPAALIEKVGAVAGLHGVGRIDMVEDRVVGIKSRELYECPAAVDRKSTRLNSSHVKISYAVFCLKKKTLNGTRCGASSDRDGPGRSQRR